MHTIPRHRESGASEHLRRRATHESQPRLPSPHPDATGSCLGESFGEDFEVDSDVAEHQVGERSDADLLAVDGTLSFPLSFV